MAYFDSSSFVIKGQNQFFFKENVVTLAKKYLLTADEVFFDKENMKIQVKGHVTGIFDQHLIIAEFAEIKLQQKSFYLQEAIFVSGDKKRLLDVENRILKLKNEKNADKYQNKIKKRAEIWNDLKRKYSQKPAPDLYFKIRSDTLTKVSKDSYQSTEASLTFCRCGDDETPAWELDSSRVLYQDDESIFLQRPVFKIKGIPVLPLPSVLFPATRKRKSGLLFPLFSYQSESGIIYKQEYYQPIYDFSEVYFGTEFFEDRGFKFTSRYNALWTPESFTNFSFEIMNDRKWVEQNLGREAVVDYYQNNPSVWTNSEQILSCLRGGNTESCFDSTVRPHLSPARNKTRGKISWHNSSRLSENWSFLSNALLTTDHRYMHEVDFSQKERNVHPYLNNQLNGFFEQSQLHLNSRFSDPIELRKDFSGYQLPIEANYGTNYVPLFSRNGPLLYGRFDSSYKKITLIRPLRGKYGLGQEIQLRLGEGNLSKFGLEFLAPLASEQIFSSHLFLQAEGKNISTDFALIDKDQKINSLYQSLIGPKESFHSKVKAGLAFSLPMEATFDFNAPLIGSFSEDSEKQSSRLNHRLFWNLDFYYLDHPYSKGDYGRTESHYSYDDLPQQWNVNHEYSRPLTYTLDELYDLEAQRKIEFSTTHRLLLSRNGDKNSNTKLISDEKEVLLFASSLDYDFAKQQEERRNYEPSYFSKYRYPLSPLKTFLGVQWSPFKTTIRSDLDFFAKDFSQFDFLLSFDLPLNLTLGYGYNYKKAFDQNSFYEKIFSLVTKQFSLKLAFIKNSFLDYSIQWKDDPFGATSTLTRTVSLKYEPSSNCWGIQGSWSRGDEVDQFKGSYYLSFYIKFLNNFLGTPNLFGSMQKDVS